MNEEQDIEKLFSKKFEKFEVQSSEEEWSKLSTKLSRFNFLRFSFVTFNVYYLLALFAFAGTVTLTSVNNQKLSKEINHLEQIIDTYQRKDSIEFSPSIPSDSTAINQQNNENELHKKNILIVKRNDAAKEGANAKLAEPSNTVPVFKDTVQKNNTKFTQSDTARYPKVKKVKKTVTIKKDNIIVKDTVVINKQGK